MFNPFKEFLAPKYVVGLSVGNRYMSAVRVYNALNSIEVDHIALKEVESRDQIRQELQDFLRQEKLLNDTIVTCLSTSQAIVRQISMPPATLGKLEKIIKYQMEPHLPEPIDDMIVDFLPPKGDGDVATFAVPKALLSEQLAHFLEVGVEPRAVSIDDMALYSLYLYSRNGDMQQTISIIHLDDRKSSVQVIHQGTLDFIRVMPKRIENIESLLETYNLYLLKREGIQLEQILLTGIGSDDDGLAESIEAQTGVKTSSWRPFDKVKHRLGEIETGFQSKLSVPLGLAISGANPPVKSIDMRKEEFELTNSVSLKYMSVVVISILLLLGFFTFNLYSKLQSLERHYSELKASAKEIFVEAFPNATGIIKGRELAQFSQRVETEMNRFEWLETMRGRGTVLEVLKILTEAVYGFSDVKIENLSVEGEEIRLDGNAGSLETVDKLEKKLATTGLFKTIKLVGAKIDRKDQTFKFNFAIGKSK